MNDILTEYQIYLCHKIWEGYTIEELSKSETRTLASTRAVIREIRDILDITNNKGISKWYQDRIDN